MKKVICCVIVVTMLIFTFSFSSLGATVITSQLQEPMPSEHTAYLVITAENNIKIFMVSSGLPIKDLYLSANFTGSKWQLTTGSLADGLMTDISITRFNGITGEFENAWVVSGDLHVQDIYTASSYTHYISYGIPVEKNNSLTIGSVDWQGHSDTQITLIKSAIDTLNSRMTTNNNYLNNIEEIASAISVTCNSLLTEATTIKQNTSTIITRLTSIKNYLEQEIPKIKELIDTTNFLIQKVMAQLDTVISQLDTANYWLENIYNALIEQEGTTYPNENQSGIDEYNSMESELMIDNSADIDRIFEDSVVLINPNAIAFINNMIQDTVLSIPEISAIIMLFLALGIAVLILGRRV